MSYRQGMPYRPGMPANEPGSPYQPGVVMGTVVPDQRQGQVVMGGVIQGREGHQGQTQMQVRLAGKRRSVLVGINYFGTSAELAGCINDVRRVQPLLEKQGFSSDPSSQQVLLDDGSTPRQPTMENMRAAIQWLVAGAQTGDALFFHYSGHGGREQTADGYHETLCPMDFQSAGQLFDTELFTTLVEPLPSGCRLTCILDSCHSGGALNLPYLFTGTQENLRMALAGEAVQMAMSRNWRSDIARWQDGDPSALLTDAIGMGLQLWELRGKYKASQGANEAGFVTDERANVGLAVGEVICITGCRSDQTSADVGDVSAQFGLQPTARNNAGGALTSAFVQALTNMGGKRPSYYELLEHIRQRLVLEGFSQVPQIATSLLLELKCDFSLDTICLPASVGSGRDVGGGGRPVGGGFRSAGGGGFSGGSGGAADSFMASLAMAPLGMQMLEGAAAFAGGGDDRGNNDRGFEGGGGGGGGGFFGGLMGAVEGMVSSGMGNMGDLVPGFFGGGGGGFFGGGGGDERSYQDNYGADQEEPARQAYDEEPPQESYDEEPSQEEYDEQPPQEEYYDELPPEEEFDEPPAEDY